MQLFVFCHQQKCDSAFNLPAIDSFISVSFVLDGTAYISHQNLYMGDQLRTLEKYILKREYSLNTFVIRCLRKVYICA